MKNKNQSTCSKQKYTYNILIRLLVLYQMTNGLKEIINTKSFIAIKVQYVKPIYVQKLYF